MTVHIEWGDPAVDWDLYVVDANGEVVAQSATGGDANEDAVLVDPPPGQYTAHLVNYEGGETSDWTLGEVRFRSPTPTFYGPKETWQLTCEDKEGHVRAMRNLVVDRGERVNVGRVCSSAAIAVAKRQ